MKRANEARSAELAIIISYPTSASGIIVLLITPQRLDKSSRIYFVRKNRVLQYTDNFRFNSFHDMSHVYQKLSNPARVVLNQVCQIYAA